MLLGRFDIPSATKELEALFEQHQLNQFDFKKRALEVNGVKVSLFYFSSFANGDEINRDVLSFLVNRKAEELTPEKLYETITVEEVLLVKEWKKVLQFIAYGGTLLHVDGHSRVLILNNYKPTGRSISEPNIENQILGPRIAFTENIISNSALLRNYITSPTLTQETVHVGIRSKTPVSIFYIKDLAKEEHVSMLKERIENIKFDAVIDSAMLVQWIEDNTLSLFPQLLLSERVDRSVFSLLQGKIVVLVGGSSMAIISPARFADFFKSTEDHYTRWNRTTFIRMLRFFAMFVSLFFTATYVASLTYHYEVIPEAFLVPLAQSRTLVPFPPLIEALFLELIIELLAEAGARLPTKIGQTIGIVGGIVIGQAAVQAGFTSNILIIIVALSALSSYTTPVYSMSNTIRILRFPMIILAGMLGFVGIMSGLSFLLIHLLRQQSLKTSYLFPFFPLQLSNLKDTILRLPFAFFGMSNPLIADLNMWKVGQKSKKGGPDIDE